ncbi:hypothetical protein D3C76_1262050 [compost metagenome]
MTLFTVLEGKEQPFLFKQTQDKIQVRFLILRTVTNRLERLAQTKLMVGQLKVIGKNFLDDLLGGFVLKNA